jgi:hypothetical protein
VPPTIKVGLTKVGNQAKPQIILKKSCILYLFRTNFKHTATNLNTQPTMMQQRLTCDSKMPGCCCLNKTGNKILFRINWQGENQGFNVAL